MFLKIVFVPLLLSFLLTSCNVNKTPTPSNDVGLNTNKANQPTVKAKPPILIKAATQKNDVNDTAVILEPAKEYRDAWWHIKNSTGLPQLESHYFQSQLNWFARHPEYLDRVARRAEPYLYYIIKELKKHDMPLELALLPIVESGYQSFAYSHGSAAGIWQFIPSTGRLYGLKQNWWYDGRRDVILSTQAAIQLLKRLNKAYDGDWLLTLAAYNWGPGNLNRAIRKNKKRNKKTGFWDLKLPAETRNYVPKLLALNELVKNPEKHGIKWLTIPYQPSTKVVTSSTQIDLALVAELAEVPIEMVYRYNSGFNRWATPPNGPHEILLPIEAANKFKQGLAKTPKNKRVTWKRHKIKKGETLSRIAQKYQTTIPQIRSLNNLYKKTIRAGTYIIVPTAGKKFKNYSLSSNQRSSALHSKKRKGNKVIITVKQGDTFWDLSQQYKVSIRTLAKWNGMAPKDRLKIGQKLVIWTNKPSSSVRHLLFNDPKLTKLTSNKRINYSVRRGDSLARIADKFKVTINDLKRWNKNIKSTKYIQPGQKLRLYIDVRKQSG